MQFVLNFLEWQADVYREMDTVNNSRAVKVGGDSLSCDHNFVPYPALMAGKLLKKGDKKLLTYSRWIQGNPSYHDSRRTYDSFLEAVVTNCYNWTKFKKRGVELDFRARYGELIHVQPDGQVVPLAVLTVNSRYLYSIDKANPDPTQFMFVINNDLVRKEEYDSLYRAFKKYCLVEIEKIVDVIFTNDIHKLLYKPHIVKPRPAKNIMEMRENMLIMHSLVLQDATEPYRT